MVDSTKLSDSEQLLDDIKNQRFKEVENNNLIESKPEIITGQHLKLAREILTRASSYNAYSKEQLEKASRIFERLVKNAPDDVLLQVKEGHEYRKVSCLSNDAQNELQWREEKRKKMERKKNFVSMCNDVGNFFSGFGR